MTAIPRRCVLATNLAALLLISPPFAIAATTWTVNSCSDDSFGNPGAHTGTLRFAAGMAGNGDTIDLSQLTCSLISLKSGAIALAQDDIELLGPGVDALTISGKYGVGAVEHDRVIRHSGNGWLTVRNLTVAYGYLDPNAYDDDGGCIRSQANVLLTGVKVAKCETYAVNGNGGGVATQGALWIVDSKIMGNVATTSHTTAAEYGGGVYVVGDLMVVNSTISDNAVGASGDGGGIFVRGNASILYSTISDNSATNGGGGMFATSDLLVANSTISGNTSDIGAVETGGAMVTFKNSTVAWNTANRLPGIALRPYQPMSITLQSSLIAANTYAYAGSVIEDDLDRCCAAAQATITIDGAHNIVRVPSINLPAGVATTGVCPLLGPLRNNGGPTRTHALLSTSPGIDEGDAGTFQYDQRGFFRTSGIAADVGAYEIDQDDVIFNNAFDGCP